MGTHPLAYHVTFGTYGTRLHGDSRGTVDRRQNTYGEPIIGANTVWERDSRARLKYDPVVLTLEQRIFIERIVPDICTRGGWKYHVTAAAPDHVHNLLTADADGDAVRKWFKRWLGEALSARWPLPIGQSWWAESGSAKWVWMGDYYARCDAYVRGQRTLRET